LSALIDAFGRSSLHVVLYDDLVREQRRAIEDMMRFLDLDPVPTDAGAPANASFVPDSSQRVRSLLYRGVLRARPLGRLVPAGVQRRAGYLSRKTLLVKPTPLAADVRARLTDSFADDIRSLGSLVDVDVSR